MPISPDNLLSMLRPVPYEDFLRSRGIEPTPEDIEWGEQRRAEYRQNVIADMERRRGKGGWGIGAFIVGLIVGGAIR